MSRKTSITTALFALCFLFSGFVQGQITAPGADDSEKTAYPTFKEIDDVFIFCAQDSLGTDGILRATTQLAGTKTFLWEVYNDQTAAFDFYSQESSDGTFAEISGLADGGYRVTITLGATTEIHRAWVFNNWTVAAAVIEESNCVSFNLSGSFRTAVLTYYDLVSNAELEVFKDVKVQWKDGSEIVSTILDFQNFSPPTKNTDYTLRVYDKFNCEAVSNTTYESIVTKAIFSVDPSNGEAPLTATFTNQSENGDVDQYEWFLFRDLDEIKREGENSNAPIDSIMIIAYDESPVYTYENSGTYIVKMVSKKISEFNTCVDTVYIENNIVVDTSFIDVPNVFTPNGDGTNDEFVIQFWSMQSLRISIFNRWGKRIHFWENDDIHGFDGTWTESVWDGRLMGGRMASPGVYYFNVEGKGRDGSKRRTNGFFHLFRGKS